MSNITTYTHPFKQGVMDLLNIHFATDITKNFRLAFESDLYDAKTVENIFKQTKDDRLIMEVHYDKGDGVEFICDLYSWESKSATTQKLLTAITEAIEGNRIGDGWVEDKDGKISNPVQAVITSNLKGGGSNGKI